MTGEPTSRSRSASSDVRRGLATRASSASRAGFTGGIWSAFALPGWRVDGGQGVAGGIAAAPERAPRLLKSRMNAWPGAPVVVAVDDTMFRRTGRNMMFRRTGRKVLMRRTGGMTGRSRSLRAAGSWRGATVSWWPPLPCSCGPGRTGPVPVPSGTGLVVPAGCPAPSYGCGWAGFRLPLGAVISGQPSYAGRAPTASVRSDSLSPASGHLPRSLPSSHLDQQRKSTLHPFCPILFG